MNSSSSLGAKTISEAVVHAGSQALRIAACCSATHAQLAFLPTWLYCNAVQMMQQHAVNADAQQRWECIAVVVLRFWLHTTCLFGSLLCHTYYILAGVLSFFSMVSADAADVDATAQVQYSTAPLQYSFVAG